MRMCIIYTLERSILGTQCKTELNIYGKTAGPFFVMLVSRLARRLIDWDKIQFSYYKRINNANIVTISIITSATTDL